MNLQPWARPLARECNSHINDHYKDPPSTKLLPGAPTKTQCHVRDKAVPFIINGVGTCWRMILDKTRPIYNDTAIMDKKEVWGSMPPLLKGQKAFYKKER
eukprot:3887857-Heterocapsa_arctica.AAC.1